MNFSLLLPEIILFCGALTILLSDVFFAKKQVGEKEEVNPDFFYRSHLLAIGFCAAALFFIVSNFVTNELAFSEMFLTNSYISLIKSAVVLLLTVVILLSLGFIFVFYKISAEFLALLMIATVGGMFLISANDFLIFYLGIELQALSLYLLAAIKRDSKQSSEAGMKYFILGCLASGILLFGISMVYGFSGTTNFSALADLYQKNDGSFNVPAGVLFGFILVLTAMFFKMSAAPFHMWSPDVYQGSPAIVTTFFATVVKLTVTIALIKLVSTLFVGWPGVEKIFLFIAILSMAVGSFGAIFQKNIKRLLAYSSIGHVGFILLGLSALNIYGYSSSTFYILIYSMISIGGFGFILLIKDRNNNNHSQENDATNDRIFDISSLSGLAKTNPVMAFSLAVLVFSMAGIPPLAGFFSKFYVIQAALSAQFYVAAVIAVLFSVISAYYYLRIIKIMYFDEAKEVINLDDITNVKAVIFIAAMLNILLIFFLHPVMDAIKLTLY